MHISKFSSLFIACFILLVSSAPGAQPQTENRRRPAPKLDTINAAMQQFVDDGTIAGAVTLVGHQGRIVHLGAVGKANLESNRKMQPNALFSIASMTKPIVATAVMMLEEEGKLSVDDPVSKYLPEFAELQLASGSAPARMITIRDALTHTSGLGGNQVFDGSLQEAVSKLAARPLDFEPGTKWQYSPGLNVAGRIVEVVSGMPLQEFLQQRIFEPLMMNNTTFFPNDDQLERIAVLYGPGEDEGTLQPTENRITEPQRRSGEKGANPSGGLYATARDMFRFYQMVLSGGQFRRQRLMSQQAVSKMTTCQTENLETGFTPGNCWGLGWCIVREPQGVTAMLSPGTFGHGGAFGTQGWVDPETKTIYVLMIQRTGLPNSDASDVRKAFQEAANAAIGI